MGKYTQYNNIKERKATYRIITLNCQILYDFERKIKVKQVKLK